MFHVARVQKCDRCCLFVLDKRIHKHVHDYCCFLYYFTGCWTSATHSNNLMHSASDFAKAEFLRLRRWHGALVGALAGSEGSRSGNVKTVSKGFIRCCKSAAVLILENHLNSRCCKALLALS